MLPLAIWYTLPLTLIVCVGLAVLANPRPLLTPLTVPVVW